MAGNKLFKNCSCLWTSLIVWWISCLCWVPSPCASWSIPRQEKQTLLSSTFSRRDLLIASATASILAVPQNGFAADDMDNDVQVFPEGDARQLFNEGRAFESQGNMAAAQRLYAKVTRISPKFIYGWSNLGNTQVALGDLPSAEQSYSTAINLCNENLRTTEEGFGVKRCSDLYVLLLNRGSVRLNNGMQEAALKDLEQSNVLRARPDAVLLQNLARAEEVNGLYAQADRDYNVAISMTANEVAPFWLRSALVKFQLGDIQGGFDLFKRVENRFPEAPEVRAAYAAFLAARGDQIAAQRKYLEIPDRQRSNYLDQKYLRQVITWPPAAIEGLAKVTSAVKM